MNFYDTVDDDDDVVFLAEFPAPPSANAEQADVIYLFTIPPPPLLEDAPLPLLIPERPYAPPRFDDVAPSPFSIDESDFEQDDGYEENSFVEYDPVDDYSDMEYEPDYVDQDIIVLCDCCE